MFQFLKKWIATDRFIIIDKKIQANQAQHGLDRLAAEISAYSSNDLRKYVYLDGEDLGYKHVVEQAKFDYSPLGNILNMGLDKGDQKERLFKRLENIRNKKEELLKAYSTTKS